MRKGLVVLLAALVVAVFAVPAMADLSASGFIRSKAHVEQNYNANAGNSGGGFILPVKDAPTASYVEQRARIKFDFKGENAGGVAFFEIDFTRFGDAAYQSGLRNQGAGLEADTINLETKNVYVWFNVPNTSAKFTVGLQNITDSFGGMIFGYADAAGIFLTGKMAPVEYRLGWSKLEAQSSFGDSSVDLYVAEVKLAPVKEAKIGLDVYVIRDASGVANAGNLGSNATTLRTAFRGFGDYAGATPTFTYTPSVFYFVGLDGAFDAGVAKLSGYAFYNGGKVKDAVLAGIAGGDIDVKAWAADLRADVALGPGKAFIEAAYVTGTSDTDSDIKSPVTTSNYALAGSFPLTSMDTQILFPNLDDINASSALAYDVQNKLRGIMAVAAGVTMKFADALTGKVGAAYLQDAKNTFQLAGAKKHKATEINANVNFNVTKGVDVGLYGAYAFLSDWESFSRTVGTNTAVADVTKDADNIYKVYARLNYAF